MSNVTAIASSTSVRAAFDKFMRPHFEALYSRAHRLTGNVDDAEDLVQELLIRVYQHFDQVKRADNPKSWLLRVLYRLFVDFTRRNARSPLRPITPAEEDGTSMSMACDEPGPADHVERILTQQRLRRALEVLRPEEQVLLVLHELEGCSLTELEELTGLPEGTLKSRLHRARIKLGRILRTQESGTNVDPGGTNHELPAVRRSVG
jgi:RNA polymerase sigma-70 factor (ECF subfamily)